MKKKNIIALVCSIFTLSTAAVSTINLIAESSSDFKFEKADIKSEYSIGETVVIPKIKAIDDGSECDVTATIQLDMKVLAYFDFSNGNGLYLLNDEGDYLLTYTSYDSYNKIHTLSYSFKVDSSNYIDIDFDDDYSLSSYITTEAYAMKILQQV